MTSNPHGDLDEQLAADLQHLFGQLDPTPPPFVPAGRRRRVSRPVIVVGAIALAVAVPASAITVHRSLVDKAFSDMGVRGAAGAPASYHLVVEQQVSADLTVRLYGSPDLTKADTGKTGKCLFAESVVAGKASGGKGWCFTPEPGGAAPVFVASQYVVVQLDSSATAAGTVTAQRLGANDVQASAKEGYAVLPHLASGRVDLTYRAAGEAPRSVPVDVP